MIKSLVATLGVCVLTITLTGCSTSSGQDTKYQKQCQDLVLETLKAPASAKFSNWNIEKEGSSTFLVSGSVDSQNGFGALLRSNFVCEYDGSEMYLNSITSQ